MRAGSVKTKTERTGVKSESADRPFHERKRRLVFVYGSLLKGESNHGQLRGARFVGEGISGAGFHLYDLGDYPGLVPGGDTSVRGEVYAIGAALLSRLDRFEGHPHLFERRRLRLAGGEDVEAYFLVAEPAADRPRVRGGDWRRRAEDAYPEPAAPARTRRTS